MITVSTDIGTSRIIIFPPSTLLPTNRGLHHVVSRPIMITEWSLEIPLGFMETAKWRTWNQKCMTADSFLFSNLRAQSEETIKKNTGADTIEGSLWKKKKKKWKRWSKIPVTQSKQCDILWLMLLWMLSFYSILSHHGPRYFKYNNNIFDFVKSRTRLSQK